MDLGLENRVAIVTGATANIGRAVAIALAGEGVKLVAVGRDAEAGARLVAKARGLGAAEAIFVKADLLEKGAAKRIVAAAEALGPVYLLVNGVGGNVGAGLFADSDPESWQGDLDINLTTVLAMTHAVLPGMIAAKAGRVIHMGSVSGIVGDYMLPVYSAAKGAVHAFTRVLAKEVGAHNITVNAVAPYGTLSTDPEAFSSGSRFNRGGFFATAFQGLPPEENVKRQRRTVLPRPMAYPEEVAGAVLWLASDQAAFVTGQVIQVDGGSLL